MLFSRFSHCLCFNSLIIVYWGSLFLFLGVGMCRVKSFIYLGYFPSLYVQILLLSFTLSLLLRLQWSFSYFSRALIGFVLFSSVLFFFSCSSDLITPASLFSSLRILSSTFSNLLVNSSSEIFISVSILLSCRISIWIWCYLFTDIYFPNTLCC